MGEFLQAVESVRLRESRESVLVLGNNGKDAMAIKNDKDIGNGNQGGGNIFGNGNQGVVNILPTVGLHRACRETTMPSLSGSVSRYFEI